MRELARAQGFPDNFRFEGKYVARYRMIGNAVPIPLAYAIGVEIRKCFTNTTNSSEGDDIEITDEYISVEE